MGFRAKKRKKNFDAHDEKLRFRLLTIHILEIFNLWSFKYLEQFHYRYRLKVRDSPCVDVVK